MIAPVRQPEDYYPPSGAHADEIERELRREEKGVATLEDWQRRVGELVAANPVRYVVIAVAVGLALGYLVKRKGR